MRNLISLHFALKIQRDGATDIEINAVQKNFYLKEKGHTNLYMGNKNSMKGLYN